MAKKPDWVVSCRIADDLYDKWKTFILDNGLKYTGAQSSMKQIHSDLMSMAIDNLMCSSKEDIEKFLEQYRKE